MARSHLGKTQNWMAAMADSRPFYLLVRNLLAEKFWTVDDLYESICQSRLGGNGKHHLNGNGESKDQFKESLNQVLEGTLAPTESLGELIADVLVGRSDSSGDGAVQQRESLVGAAYVAEQHGRRQQHPYVFGVFGQWRHANLASTVDGTDFRRLRLRQAQQERFAARLAELEEQQRSKKQKSIIRPEFVFPWESKSTGRRSVSVNRPRRLSQEKDRRSWNRASNASRRYIPAQAKRKKRSLEISFLDVVHQCFEQNVRIGGFLQALLSAWRRESLSRRGRLQERMSPEQLGAIIGTTNRGRYRKDRQKQKWFRQNKGFGITGTAFRNYLDGRYEKPLRECIQKIVWAFCVDGDIQHCVEQKLWRLGNRKFLIHPCGNASSEDVEDLVKIVDRSSISTQLRRKLSKAYLPSGQTFPSARVATVEFPEEGIFKAFVDRDGVLLSPLVCPETRRVIADFSHLMPDGRLRTRIDVALAGGKRSALMRALIDHSGIPITRIAELTEIHESMFQQWMRAELQQRIEDSARAIRIVELLNSPELARWPISPQRIADQNTEVVKMLTKNATSLDTVLRQVNQLRVPTKYGLDVEGERTFRAAHLLREVFGRGSLTNLRGAEIGRQLHSANLGNEQTFRHLREGVRDGGRRSARRANLEQAACFASLIEEQLGNLSKGQRKSFVEQVACVDLDRLASRESPMTMLRRVKDPSSPFTLRDVFKEMVAREGGLGKFSHKTRVTTAGLRQILSTSGHHMHHRVARLIAKLGLGFHPDSEEYRQFVVIATAAWQKGRVIRLGLSEIYLDYVRGVKLAETTEQFLQLRADTMGAILSQAALSSRELARKLRVTQPVIRSWTSPRVGHFTDSRVQRRFVELMGYQGEQRDFLEESFGTIKTAREMANTMLAHRKLS